MEQSQTPRIIPVHVAEKLLENYDTAVMGARTLEEQVFRAKVIQAEKLRGQDYEGYKDAGRILASKEEALALAKTEAAALAVSIARKALEDWMTPGTPKFPED